MNSATATSKRRRTSMSSTASLASRGDDEGSLDLEYQPEQKRKKVIKLDPIEQCQQVFDIIRYQKKEDGSLLCESFIRVPKKRQDPLYHEMISNPIDMQRINQKIKMDEYEDVEQMSADVEVMVENAKTFFKKPSQEHKDASDLWELFTETKSRLFERDPSEEGDKKGKIILKMGKLAKRALAAEKKPLVGEGDAGETSESSSTATDKQDDGENSLATQLEELFSSVMLAADVDGRQLHTMFQLLPSKKKYPDYYEVIDTPIDLKMIACKIQTGEMGSLNELEKDLLLMCKNACIFNEPGSQIYKDAKSLKKVITAKKIEIEHGKSNSNPGKTSERIRNRRLRSGLSHSAITAALQYEDDEEEEEMEEVAEEEDHEQHEPEPGADDEDDESHTETDGESPLWLLYDHINSITAPGNTRLADPFRRLPSKRFYPDYYKEIKTPISIAQIKMKIKKGDYLNVQQEQADFNIMFENAKIYNRPDSNIYKAAVKLQRALTNKVHELLNEPDEIFMDDGSKDNLESDSETGAGLSSPGSSSLLEASLVSKVSPPGKKKGKWTPKVETIPAAGKKDFLSKGLLSPNDALKKRLNILYKTLVEYTEPNGRIPIEVFMEKPSKKLYPDYYAVIREPIDMLTIENNIKVDKYSCSDDLLKDFYLMFNNCRQYNEEGSLIYEDANRLEKLINDKRRELGLDPGVKKKKVKRSPTLTSKQKKLLEVVRDHKDKNGRVLSLIFQKLPSKMEYPEYYEVIKNPIDLERISNKVRTYHYDSLEAIVSDLMLMLDNACKFNEPDSQIYKDALILQRLTLQTKLSLADDDNGIPDVCGAVREILTSIFISVYNHQDEEGRCYTDTMSELPEYDEVDGVKERALSLDLIKGRLDRGFYKRLDNFQRDMFLCFDRARKTSRTDSQIFEDSLELQSNFIRTRDELCNFGEVLKSSALKYKQADLNKAVEALKIEKKAKETPQDEEVLSEVKKEEAAEVPVSQSEIYNEQTYNIGDFVYLSHNSGIGNDPLPEGTKGAAKNIANIQKLWTQPDGTKMFEGIWFFRPDQTYHLPTRKFLEKEVFRSEVRSTAALSEIIGKCFVMTVKGKEYFHYAPEGYVDEDVYVCEYRYSSRGRCFTKLKSWAFDNDRIKLIPRPKPLEPIRISSVFTERDRKMKEETVFLEEDLEKIPKEKFPNIQLTGKVGGKEDVTFYEQYNLPCGPIRVGDYVYVRVENAKKLIARVDSMWAETSGITYFHGPWFTSLSEISPSSVPPGRVFYKQEIFQSSIEDTNPLLSICGKCAVLDVEDYMKFRPTEVSEDDVYVCESLYEEVRRQIKKFDGLKKVTWKDPRVHENEIYFFRRPIPIVKVDLDGTIIPEMPKLKAAGKFDPLSPIGNSKLELDSLMEDSLDSSPPSLSATEMMSSGTPNIAQSGKKSGKTPGKKIVTGYILYSSEVRRGVAEKNPASTFGEISRIVGNDWKKLTSSEKQVYEERAVKFNAEKEIALAAGNEFSNSPSSKYFKDMKPDIDWVAATNALKKDPDWIFECCWEKCDWQFEDALDLIEHCVQEPKGHVATSFKDSMEVGEFQCHWKNCQRVKKGVNPFPTLQRLIKHVRDIHILKGNGRIIHPDMRSKNIQLSRTTLANKAAEAAAKALAAKTAVNATVAQAIVHQHQPQVIIRPAAPPAEPLFIAVPPRPQKLVHSEAYIRYIESLHNEQRYMTNWEKTLKATVDNTAVPDVEKLPSQWLGNGAGNHGSVVNALWALRDFMMRDALGLRRVLNQE